MPKVTVISPIYKVERFIERTAESMLSQTLDDIEYIFVDDCTPDKSIEVLESVIAKHPERKDSIKIIHHDVNKGLPAARNTGLEHATGDYVFHWDSDDYAELSMLKEMYEHAVGNDFDIVWCDWFLTFEKNERRMSTPDYETPRQALSGMLEGSMKYNVWNKLAKRSLYKQNDIRFPEGYGMGEDLTMLLVFAYAKKSGRLPKAYYHYLKTNTNAFSNSLKSIHFEPLKRNVIWIAEELHKIYGQSIEKEIAFLKLQSKYPLLSASGKFADYRKWNDWFPEANNFISYNKNISLRSKLLQLFAKNRLYGFVFLHYWLVNKVVYGIIYK